MPETDSLVDDAPPLKVWSADQLLADASSDALLIRQVPPILKQPVRILIPPPVEVNVEVPLATKFPTPCTEKMEPGVELPMPTLPFLSRMRRPWFVLEAIWKMFFPIALLWVPSMVKTALGVDVPTPTKPFLLALPMKKVGEVEPVTHATNCGEVEASAPGAIESIAHGVEVPIPMRPVDA